MYLYILNIYFYIFHIKIFKIFKTEKIQIKFYAKFCIEDKVEQLPLSVRWWMELSADSHPFSHSTDLFISPQMPFWNSWWSREQSSKTTTVGNQEPLEMMEPDQ